jgi:manganese/zinc/iron transport system permease protein
MAMLGDAISHAVLPGIVIAYFFSDSYQSIPMLLGAASVGLLSTYLIETFNKIGRLQEDASIGVTYTWLFALGVVMISLMNDNVDLDQDCVLYGEIAYVPLDLMEIGSFLIPKAVINGAFLTVFIFIMFRIGYKGFKLTTFDPVYATAIGVSVGFWHYLLMGMVSTVTILSFESIGAILVLAFLVVPAATAYLLTTSLKKMLWLSVFISLIAVFSGYILAYMINGSISGAMASVLGLEFFIVFVFQLLSKKFQRRSLA